jgi:hypothetical protein
MVGGPAAGLSRTDRVAARWRLKPNRLAPVFSFRPTILGDGQTKAKNLVSALAELVGKAALVARSKELCLVLVRESIRYSDRT